MPVPEGQITGSQIWQSPIQPVDEFIDEEPTDEEMAEDITAFDKAVVEEQNETQD